MATQAAALPQARAYLRLVLIGVVIGIPASLAAALFMAFVHTAEDWVWQDLPDWLNQSAPPWYLVIGLPVVGAAVVLAARRLLPGDGGHEPLLGISADPVPWQHAPSVILAALGTLVFGAVLGPEAPLIALGSIVGMVAVSLSGTKDRAAVVLATAGSFAAVSALFGGPLVAAMLLLEAGLAAGPALVPALVPGLVAAATGYVLFVGFGSWGGLNTISLTEPGLPAYDGIQPGDLALAVAVGLLTALLIVVVRHLARQVDRVSKRNVALVLLAGGLAVGIIAQVAGWLGADTQDVLFSGQTSVPAVVTEGSVGIVLVLVLAKALGYAVSLGCGFRGGPVFPAIFLGAGLATFPILWFDTSPTWAVAVGAAAGMAAGTRLVFSGVLISALLVGPEGKDAIPAAVLAAATAWLTVVALEGRQPHPDEPVAPSEQAAPA